MNKIVQPSKHGTFPVLVGVGVMVGVTVGVGVGQGYVDIQSGQEPLKGNNN